MISVFPLTRFQKAKIFKTSSGLLLIEVVKSQSSRLFIIFLLGIGGAILEGLTFAFLAKALELLSTSSGFGSDRLGSWGISWLASLSSGQQFVALIIISVTCQIIKSLFQVTNTQLSNYTGACSALEVQKKVLSQIMSMEFATASKFKVGELTNMVLISDGVAQLIINLLAWLTNIFTVFAYVFVLCRISGPLFFAAMILFGSVLILQKYVGKKVGILSHQLAVEQGDVSRKIVEGISAIKLIFTFQKQQFFLQQVEKLQISYIQTMQKLNARMGLLGPISDSILLLGLGCFLLIGFFVFKENRSNLLPDLLTFVAVLNRLSGRISQIGMGWTYIKMYYGRYCIIEPLFECINSSKSCLNGRIISKIQNSIVFQNVDLIYDKNQEKALNQINLNWPVGTSLALVGPSGSGKSSFADLVLRVYEPTNGNILIDGIDLKDFDTGSWRNLLGVVSQDTLLFNTSIRENLLFAKPDATEAELLEAVQAADAFDFIEKLPQRLDTLIGERGFMLSGGQRQRLAIARALLRKPSILILDEATSALDTNAEQSVQSTLDSLPSGGTRLIIAHRLSTIRNADQIVVFEQGKIVEMGVHDDLIQRQGLYWQLWQKQTGKLPNSNLDNRGVKTVKELEVV
jgi:ATP-binding cassette subfamily B protein/subfamily B ATP-binding cassette protein MsbA